MAAFRLVLHVTCAVCLMLPLMACKDRNVPPLAEVELSKPSVAGTGETRAPAGTTVPLTIWRNGKTDTVRVKVEQLAPESAMTAAPVDDGASQSSRAGLTVSDLTREQRAALKISNGVLVRAVDGAALRSGIMVGDVIVAVNNVPIRSVAELETKLADQKGKTVAVLVRRDDLNLFLPLRLG